MKKSTENKIPATVVNENTDTLVCRPLHPRYPGLHIVNQPGPGTDVFLGCLEVHFVRLHEESDLLGSPVENIASQDTESQRLLSLPPAHVLQAVQVGGQGGEGGLVLQLLLFEVNIVEIKLHQAVLPHI